MDVELVRERRKAEMFRIYYGLAEDCPVCRTPMQEKPAVDDQVTAFCTHCAYTCQRWVH